MSWLKTVCKALVVCYFLPNKFSNAQEPSKTVATLLRNSKLLDDDVKLLKDDVLKVIVDGEYVVQLNSKVKNSTAAIERIRKMAGGNVKHVYSNAFVGVSLVKMSDFQMTQILNSKLVTRAARNLKLSLQEVQQDAAWGLDRITPPMDSEYEYKYDGSGVSVYVVDSGIRLSHKEFTGRASCGLALRGTDCADRYYGHGTHVAGIVGGATFGVAKNVTLIAVKIFGDDGYGTFDDAIMAMDYVIGEKKKKPNTPMVINMSYGGSFYRLKNLAVSAAARAGIVCVAAAGNYAEDACRVTPASSTGAITVAATANDDTRVDFSNYGSCVDILAPGVDIRSASNTSDSASVVESGTSMASPHVAGVAALHLQKNPKMKPNEVLKALQTDASLGVITFPPITPHDCDFFNPKYDTTPNLFLTVSSLLT